MSVLVQISDPHFGTERQKVVAALETLVQRTQPEAVVISGDITQRARSAQFAAARAFVERLGAPQVLAIPGNHDIPLFNVLGRVLQPYAGFSRAFGASLEPFWASESMLVICVNTTRAGRHKDGEVSNAQIERVCTQLRAATPEQARIVVTHQPVHVIRTKDIENLLHGHEAAIRAWSAAGADIIMGGHIHLPYVRLLNEVHTGLPREVWAVQAGTAVSSRVRGTPNSVNVVRHARGERVCVIERWDYDAAQDVFQRASEKRFRPERR